MATQWLQNMVSDGKGTTRVRKNYSTETQKRLSQLKKNTWTTLGSNGLHVLVQTPDGENADDWIGLHVMDFFNELSMLAELATTHEDADQFRLPGKGFPPGIQYKWRDAKSKKAQAVSGPDYINFTVAYIEGVLDDPDVFPLEENAVYSDDYIPTVKELYLKMFRIFAILYGAFLETLKSMECSQHLNTSFKHFVFFGICHGLMPKEKELAALKSKVTEYRTQYETGMRNYSKEKKSTVVLKGEKSFHVMDVDSGMVKDV